MAQEGKFNDVPEEDIPLLLADLKTNFPMSIHAWSFLRTIMKWKDVEPTIEAKILALNGNFRSKMIFYYTVSSDRTNFRCSFHKWTRRDDDTDIMTEALINTQNVPWNAPVTTITALTPETDKAVIPALIEIWKGESWVYETGHHVYWMPKDEAVKLIVGNPEGTEFSSLNTDHAKEMNSWWTYKHSGSEHLIATFMQVNSGIGLFDSVSREMLSWAQHNFYGGVGVWQTKTNHRGKGYGRMVLLKMTKAIAEKGYDVHLNVLPDNVVSYSLVQKCGYRLSYYASWVFKGRSDKGPPNYPPKSQL